MKELLKQEYEIVCIVAVKMKGNLTTSILQLWEQVATCCP